MIAHLGPELMLLGLIAGIFTGYPVAFVLAGIGILFAVANGIPMLFLSMGVQRIYSGTLTNWLLVAIPLFVFMGLILEKSGIAERLMRSLASLFQRTPGGYAFSVLIIGVIMAASTGIIGASVVMMGMMSLPAMREAKYDIAAGLGAGSPRTGTLGILLPPSIMLIILGDQLRVSVGDLFMAAIVPGLVLSGLYFLYLASVAIFAPHRVPAPAAVARRSLGENRLGADPRPAGADGADPVGAGHDRRRHRHADRIRGDRRDGGADPRAAVAQARPSRPCAARCTKRPRPPP